MSTDTSSHPDIPEKSWTNPFAEGTWLHDEFEDVVSQSRDIIIIVDDRLGRRGTGKTVKSLKLAAAMDQTDEGMTTAKTSLSPEEIRNAYASQEKRSGLVLDEAEFGASNRQAMSKTNQALREIMSMGRVEQKYVVINSPIRGFIDTDIQKLCDVWISVHRKGLAMVHHLEWEPYSEQLLTRRKQWLQFSDIERGTQLRRVYNDLTQQKRKEISGEETQTFVPADEHEEIVEQVATEARKHARNEVIESIYQHPEASERGVYQSFLGECVGLEQATISDIVNGNYQEPEHDVL